MNIKRVEHISRSEMMARNDVGAIPASVAIISISDNMHELEEAKQHLVGCNVEFFRFLDVDDHTGITLDQARKVLSFIRRNEDKDNFIIHCFMGVSRSAAVARWINDHYGLDLPYLESYNAYNKKVYQMLEAANGTSLAAYYAAIEESDRNLG